MLQVAYAFLSSIFFAVDFMRSLGKMYVVVAVLVCIFLGLVILLYRMDQRVKKLEKCTFNEQEK